MKFYYNGKLIRKSADHIYTHAVLDTAKDNKCRGCRANLQACEQIIATEVKKWEDSKDHYRRELRAIEEGRPTFRATYKRNVYVTQVTHTREQVTELIEQMQSNIDRVLQTWKIVELEAKD